MTPGAKHPAVTPEAYGKWPVELQKAVFCGRGLSELKRAWGLRSGFIGGF